MKHSLLALGIPLVAIAAPALAQRANVERFERQLEQIQRETRLRANPDVPPGQRALFDYGGFISASYFAIDDIEQDTHRLSLYDLVGYGRLNFDGAHEFFLRARTSYRQFAEGEAFDGEDYDTTWPTIEQAWYRFDLARHFSAYKGQNLENNATITVGRQLVYWANGLVLGQTIDGATGELTVGDFSLQVLGGVTIHDTIDFDASRPNFDDHTERVFYGGMLSAQLGKHRPFIYVLTQDDQNDDDPLVVGPTTTNFEYNSFYIGTGINGSLGNRWLYGLEVVFEGGEGLSNSVLNGLPTEQTEEDIASGALDFRLDYLVGDERRTRFSHETILATGDPDRFSSTNTLGGNRAGTNDHGFNAWGLLNTGLAFNPSVSNLASFRFGASSFPFTGGNLRRLQVGTDLFFYCKFDPDAPIDEETTDDRFLGFEPDLYMNWQLTSDIALALRYGVFFPGSAIESDEHPRNFFFAGIVFSF